MPLSQWKWKWLCFRGFDGRLVSFSIRGLTVLRFPTVTALLGGGKNNFFPILSFPVVTRVGSFNILPECEGALELLTALFFGTYRGFFFRFLASGMFRFDFF